PLPRRLRGTAADARRGRRARRRPVHLDPHRWRGSRPGGHLPGRYPAAGRLAPDRFGTGGQRGDRGRRDVRGAGRLGTLPVIDVQPTSFTDPVATALMAATLADLAQLYDGDGDSTPMSPAQFTPPDG